eukprot:1326224-Amorphochlora_amoeboformis.AAC.1
MAVLELRRIQIHVSVIRLVGGQTSSRPQQTSERVAAGHTHLSPLLFQSPLFPSTRVIRGNKRYVERDGVGTFRGYAMRGVGAVGGQRRGVPRKVARLLRPVGSAT